MIMHLLRLGAAASAKIHMGLRYPKLIEKGTAHILVVVLPGMPIGSPLKSLEGHL